MKPAVSRNNYLNQFRIIISQQSPPDLEGWMRPGAQNYVEPRPLDLGIDLQELEKQQQQIEQQQQQQKLNISDEERQRRIQVLDEMLPDRQNKGEYNPDYGPMFEYFERQKRTKALDELLPNRPGKGQHDSRYDQMFDAFDKQERKVEKTVVQNDAPTIEEPAPPEPPKRQEVSLEELRPVQVQQSVPPQKKSFIYFTMTDLFNEIAALGKKALAVFLPDPTKDIATKEKLTAIQQPYKDAIDKEEKVFEHNLALCSENDLSKEDIDKANVIADIGRPNVKVGIYTMFMLHKGMGLDQIASDDPKYDSEKRQHISEFRDIIMKATNAVRDAETKAREAAAIEFDKNFNLREFTDGYIKKMTEKEKNDTTFEQLDGLIDKARARARFDAMSEAGKKAIQDAKMNSPVMQDYKNTYLAMGEAYANQPIPLKSISNMKEVVQNYSKLGALQHMAQDYSSNLISKLGGEKGFPQKNFNAVNDTAKYIGQYVETAKYRVDYAATKSFADPTIYSTEFGLAKGSQKLAPRIDAELNGKQTFSDITKDGKTNRGEELSSEFAKGCGEEMDRLTVNILKVKDPQHVMNENMKSFDLGKDFSKTMQKEDKHIQPPDMGVQTLKK